jgi:hypothetical protein
MDDRALQATLDHYRAVLSERDMALQAIEADLTGWVDSDSLSVKAVRPWATALRALRLDSPSRCRS